MAENGQQTCTRSSKPYRGRCGVEDQPAYMFIRYRVPLEQNLKNSLIKVLSIHGLYTGTLIGLTPTVNCLEGDWPRSYGIALIKFQCMEMAQMWLDSTPEVKQKDWIDGVDIIAAPCQGVPPCGKLCVELMEIQFTNEQLFRSSYSPQTEDILNKYNGTGAVVSTDRGKTLRGNWMSSGERGTYIVVNQFDSEEQFCQIYNSCEYEPLRNLRNECANCQVYLFQLEPIPQ